MSCAKLFSECLFVLERMYHVGKFDYFYQTIWRTKLLLAKVLTIWHTLKLKCCMYRYYLVNIYLDGHHKLIRWKMVTHAGIDGYSRMIMYMSCSNNNKASTVYGYFLEAVEKHGLPSRVRSDQGQENKRIAEHMLEYRGVNRGSMLTGSSVHNQRVERMWKDMHQSVTKLFYRLFYYLEEMRLLDPTSEIQQMTSIFIHYTMYTYLE